MLLVVPLMVFMMKTMASSDAGLLTIGVHIPGTDESSELLKADLTENPGNLRFILYEDSDSAIADVKSGKLTEAWLVPEDLDATISDMAAKNKTKNKIEILVREQGLTHMLGREVLCSRVYPLIARQMAADYISENVPETDIAHILDTYDNYGIEGNLFEMGYLDGADIQSDTSYLMMPLRGILALWLMLLSIAASMYYIEDEKNGLFIWWKSWFPLVRDLLYYAVIMVIPTIMVLIGLRLGGVNTSMPREILSIIVYDFALICLAGVLREIIGSIKGLGIITPILIMASALLSPVFIDFKEGRILQKTCLTFHYLYCIHDEYYVKSLMLFGIILLIMWNLIQMIKRNIKF